ncbi:MAG: [acyl-carrier-protein] S-malonyltransferase [Bacteroidetes bacterium]|nr:MAG: [acyl-carrier-protein] S-malonyltransferase [Bacteroidota bacterium]
MKAYVFPGQGAQFEGMGKDLYQSNSVAKDLFDEADAVLGYALSRIMFEGSAADLKQTKVTQPAIFVHSIAKVKTADTFDPAGVAGHSLGEFSALVAAGALSFADGLRLVQARALAMQAACELAPSTMAAVLGLEDDKVEAICAAITDEVVVPANYNSPGQIVISGSFAGVQKASEQLQRAGARKVVELAVGGAFHSPLMQPAQDRLAEAIAATQIGAPHCPVYQNVDAQPHTDPGKIKANLIAQLTAPVRWTQTIQQMAKDGYTHFVEAGGQGAVLRGLIRRIDRSLNTEAL